MFCKNCGKNLNQEDTSCPSCGTKVENQANTIVDNNKTQIKNKNKSILPIVSFTMFIVIILANIIVYPLSATYDDTSGISWFFFVFLPSILVFQFILILSIVSICNFKEDKKKQLEISKVRNIFVILNKIQLILMLLIIIYFIILFSI